MNKYSVSLHGHPTSISLEAEYWEILTQIAKHNQQSVASLIRHIDDQRIADTNSGLSSAIRVFVLKTVLHASDARNDYFKVKDDE